MRAPRGLPSALVIGTVIAASLASAPTIVQPEVNNASCTAPEFPEPYQGVSPCSSEAVTCAALNALFTWNPAADTSPDAGYLRAYPLIAPTGLQNPDGTPQQPFNPSADSAGFDTTTAWRDATDTSTALVAYTTRRSQGRTRANALFDIVQYRYPTTAVDAAGIPKPGAVPIGPAWQWWATAHLTTADDGSLRVSYLTQYSPPVEAADGKAITNPADRWSCQRPSVA